MRRLLKPLAFSLLGLLVGVYLGTKMAAPGPDTILLPFKSFNAMDGFVTAAGTVVIVEDNEQGVPLQTTDLTCIREWNHCIDARASLNSLNGGTPMLASDISLHEIESWTDVKIVTKPDDTACVSYVYTLDLTNKEVTGVRTTKRTNGLCEGVDLRPLNLRMMNGLDALQRAKQKP
jgi:hypothetical protein